MIEVISKKNGEPIGYIEIKNLNTQPRTPQEKPNEFADYNIKYAVERGSAVGTHVRNIYGFPRKYYNVFALVLQALNTLDEKELKLERDFDPDEETTVSPDLARRLRGPLREISSRFGRLHHN